MPVTLSLHAAETARAYAKNLAEGNVAYADLDAISIAIDVQMIAGDYYMTYAALDILLP